MSNISPENITETIDTLFKVVMIDIQRKKKISIQLRDSDGDEVPISETVEKLTEYVDDKVKDTESNPCKQQIMPLMAQTMVRGMSKLMGPSLTNVMLSNSDVRYSLMHMMTVGFYLLKFIQNKKIKIHTVEEDINQEDIDTYMRVDKASNMITMAANMGHDPREVVKEMLRKGLLKRQDIEGLNLDITEDKSEDKN